MSDFSSSVSREALLKSLQNLTGRSDVQLLDGYKVERATSGVEGFTSLVLRVRLSYRLPGHEDIKSHALFVKTVSPVDYQREIMKSINVFSKELLYFSQVVPQMVKVSHGKVQIPLPACYHTIEEKENASLYMEDLLGSGYRLANRSYLMDGYDYAHSSLVMKGIGKLHALSIAAEKKLDSGKGTWLHSCPEFGKEYLYFVPSPENPPTPIHETVGGSIASIKDLCQELEGLPKEAVASGALEKVLEGVWPTLCRLKETPNDNRRILIHGDFWANNMMFRYRNNNGEDEPVDVKFFDLQLAKVCHPGVDLFYFLYVNTRRQLREKYLSVLLDEYYESLSTNLKLLDGSVPPYSQSDFRADMMGKYKPFGVIMATLFCPWMMLGDEFLLPNADDMTSEKMEEMFKQGSAAIVLARFRNDPKFRSQVEDIIREFVDMALPNGVESVSSSPLLLNK
ncbi:uncharacterized protein LOC124168221 [Ischnura elegans]|uniref:uncharacterized protein LOC124168221 n=1 Tax=Ischnura elegans TaxID=197161 RepID=UPI001ED8855E|nr:uncharacterized protein LOC124168221 [Ischnura elegans]